MTTLRIWKLRPHPLKAIISGSQGQEGVELGASLGCEHCAILMLGFSAASQSFRIRQNALMLGRPGWWRPGCPLHVLHVEVTVKAPELSG